ncbi:uncharacterized protein LOC142550050 [Primulina tabacum]|uniref:uncharacterized protein LOC142550050 n=1 Tax=Primulina tabacum TaxID=48773 RepID=UPI003F59292E
MPEFNAILEIDWLAKNHSLLDCRMKNVKLRAPNQEEVIYYGKFKKQKSIHFRFPDLEIHESGQKVYLDVLSDIKGETTLALEEIPVVQEFPDVFLEKLLGTVPDREVEFEINLVLNATPISKTPYRMTPAELKVLKGQLQKLLDKKQI